MYAVGLAMSLLVAVASAAPNIYIAASGPGVGLYSGSDTSVNFRVQGPGMATLPAVTQDKAKIEFLSAIRYPDGQIKGGVKVNF